MATRTAYPPVRLHTSHSIPPAQAQAMIARYLEHALTNASLHPDATLTSTDYHVHDDPNDGVSFPQNGPTGGLTMHHLRRIEAGLRGEDLAKQTREELKALFSDEVLDGPSGDSPRKSRKEQSTEKVDGWMDPEQFALEQEVVDDEIGAELEGQGELVKEPKVKPAVDAKARKAAKKERRKKEQQQKQAG